MVPRVNEFKVIQGIIEGVAIAVVDMATIGYWAVGINPYLAVKVMLSACPLCRLGSEIKAVCPTLRLWVSGIDESVVFGLFSHEVTSLRT